MRKPLALVFALGLFVPLAACGGDDGDEDASGSASASASGTEDEETTTTEEEDGSGAEGAGADSDYCQTVQEVIDSGEAFGENFDFTDAEAMEFAASALGELRDDVDDEDVEAAYDVVIENFDEIVEAFAEAGDDPEAQAEIFEDEEITALFEDFAEAGEEIDAFTLEQCGTTLDGETEAADSGDIGGDSGEDTSLEDFADDVEACEDGDMAACDTLWSSTPSGSEAEAIAETCGGEDPEGGHFADCEATFG